MLKLRFEMCDSCSFFNAPFVVTRKASKIHGFQIHVFHVSTSYI